MPEIVLNYPHCARTKQADRLRSFEIWQLAVDARRQLCRRPRLAAIRIEDLMTRCRRLSVNGTAFDLHWECSGPVFDDLGRPVFGATEYVKGERAVVLRLNPELIGSADDLARSTALHELGHAVFEAPGWVAGSCASEQSRAFSTSASQAATANWSEWRANEFMGGFLAPRDLLHRELVKAASHLRLRLVAGDDPSGLPLLDGRQFDIDDLVTVLSERFGISPTFIEVRLAKYGLVRAD
jgi:hypothetical protein